MVCLPLYWIYLWIIHKSLKLSGRKRVSLGRLFRRIPLSGATTVFSELPACIIVMLILLFSFLSDTLLNEALSRCHRIMSRIFSPNLSKIWATKIMRIRVTIKKRSSSVSDALFAQQRMKLLTPALSFPGGWHSFDLVNADLIWSNHPIFFISSTTSLAASIRNFESIPPILVKVESSRCSE